MQVEYVFEYLSSRMVLKIKCKKKREKGSVPFDVRFSRVVSKTPGVCHDFVKTNKNYRKM